MLTLQEKYRNVDLVEAPIEDMRNRLDQGTVDTIGILSQLYIETKSADVRDATTRVRMRFQDAKVALELLVAECTTLRTTIFCDTSTETPRA